MPLDERNGNQTKCTILIVENDDDLRAGLRREVEQLGHEITVISQRAESKQQAGTKAKACGKGGVFHSSVKMFLHMHSGGA